MTVRTSNAEFLDIIEENTRIGVGWEIDIFERETPGNRLASLSRWKEFSISKVMSDTGAGQILLDFNDPQLDDATLQDALIDNENVVMFVKDGVARFPMMPETPDESHVAKDEERGYTPQGRSMAVFLEWSTILPPNYPLHTSLQWTWAATPPMASWLDLYDAAVARGNQCSLLTPTFTATHDSAGVPWATALNTEVNPGGDLLSLLKRFAEAADAKWEVTPSYDINVYQTYGHHRENEVKFWVGESELVNIVKRDRKGIASVVYTVAANQAVPFVQDAASEAKWGRREFLAETANAQDSLTAQQFGQILLQTTKDELLGFTIKVRADTTDKTVFVDYDVGDWVWIESTYSALSTAFQVQAISLKVDKDGFEDLELTLQSRREARIIALQKKFERESGSSIRVESDLIIGNRSSGGGTGGLQEIGVSNVDLGIHSPAADYTWYTVIGLATRFMGVRLQITSGGSINWAFQINSKANGLGNRMFEAVGIGTTEYNCSWPWWFKNEEDPQLEEIYIGVKNIAGGASQFTLVNLHAEQLSS